MLQIEKQTGCHFNTLGEPAYRKAKTGKKQAGLFAKMEMKFLSQLIVVAVQYCQYHLLCKKKLPFNLLNTAGRFKFVTMKTLLSYKPYRVSELCRLYDTHSLALAAMMESKGLLLHTKVNSEEDYRFGEKEVEMIFKSLGHPTIPHLKS